jgi:hypothetical protein
MNTVVGGRNPKSYKNTGVKKEICGKERCIYKMPKDRKEYVKYKGELITVNKFKTIKNAKNATKRGMKGGHHITIPEIITDAMFKDSIESLLTLHRRVYLQKRRDGSPISSLEKLFKELNNNYKGYDDLSGMTQKEKEDILNMTSEEKKADIKLTTFIYLEQIKDKYMDFANDRKQNNSSKEYIDYLITNWSKNCHNDSNTHLCNTLRHLLYIQKYITEYRKTILNNSLNMKSDR